MADNTLPTPTNNDVPSTDIRDHVYAGAMLDKAMTGTALTYTDRKGGEHDTWPGIEKKSADKLSELDNIITSLDTASFTFATVDAGIAGTTDGQYFRVPQGDNSSASFIYYRNDAGSALPVAALAGQASIDAINQLISAQDLPDGYSFAITDPDLNASLLINEDGDVNIPVLVAGDATLSGGETFGYALAIASENGDVALGVKDDGDIEAPSLITGDIKIEQAEMPGWIVAHTDDDGNIAWGIKENGDVYPEGGNSGSSSVEFGVDSSDVIAILGDSYTDSLYTLKDKSYIGNLSALSDYRFRNYGVSGNTATAINKRLVDGSVYFDGKTFAEMGAKYALIMTYQNDSAYFINHAMEYYMYNIERLIDSVMAYGAVPIIVSEWVASTSAAVQLKAICNQRGITFIDNGNLMKEVGNLVQSPFHQGHPGTRTNGVIWASLYEFVRRIPRPTRSIKIYRQRPTFAPASDADMLFSGDIERATKWKELTVSHRSLPDASEPYFEELRGRGNVTTWQVRADEYDLLGGAGVSFTDRLLVNITYPAGAVGLDLAGFSITCGDGVEVYARHVLDSTSSIGQTGDVTPGATDTSTLTSDYLAKYANPRGAWQKIGTGSGEYSFSDDLQQVMFGDQIQLMLKSASGTLVDITANYQVKDNAAIKSPINNYHPQSQLLAETFESFTSWTVSDVTSLVPLDQVNTPRNLAYSGALSSVASLMNGSTMQKNVSIAIPSTRDFTQPFTMQIELWGRYFPKAYLDNSIYGLDPTQVVDSSQAGNTFPATSPITSDTCDFRSVALRCSIGNTMTLQNTITQRDFACLFWRPLKYIVEIPAYVTASQLVLNITSESDYIQLAKIIIKEVK